MFGKEAGVFMVSGVMSQLIALKIHASASEKQSNLFACHATSHLELHEQMVPGGKTKFHSFFFFFFFVCVFVWGGYRSFSYMAVV